jgi:hypothetical protein
MASYIFYLGSGEYFFPSFRNNLILTQYLHSQVSGDVVDLKILRNVPGSITNSSSSQPQSIAFIEIERSFLFISFFSLRPP